MTTTKAIAIVDDDPEIRRILAIAAARSGWQVTECAGGADIVERIRIGFKPDMILLDMMMPGMDGIETLRELAAINCKARMCFLTGGTSVVADAARLFAEARNLSVGPVFYKPVPLNRLREVLEAA